MKERTEKEQEITEQELETIDAGARMQRASTTDVRQTRHPDGTGGIVERTVRLDS